MNILVAGGAGFIGSNLCTLLLQNHDNRVICIDNLITGDIKNITELKSNRQFTFLQADIISPLEIDFQIDRIYHLASPASPVDYYNHPIETMLANSQGTLNLLNLAVKQKARFLFASTSEIYGNPKEHPQKETYWGNVNSYGPRSCYDESKRFSESLCYTFRHKYDLDIRIIRIFNTYGPNMQKDDGRVVSNFINQAIVNQPITVYGEGKQTRSFCYVSDLITGILKVMETSGLKGEILNMGNPQELSILEIAKLIILLSKSKSKIIYQSLPQDEPIRRKPDITKAKKLLNWIPSVDLEEGLNLTIDYFKNLNTTF